MDVILNEPSITGVNWPIKNTYSKKIFQNYSRHGSPEDWQNVRWSLQDLGASNGTFINTVNF